MQSFGMQGHETRYHHLIETGQSTPTSSRSSFTSKITQKLCEMKLFAAWSVVITSLVGIVYYFSLPWFVFPGLLFIAFLASGGPTFPRVFFRTFVRDFSAISCLAISVLKLKYYSYKNYNIADIFKLTVNKYPHKTAFKFEGRSWTFQEVDEYSNKIANIFQSKGFQKGDVVALFMENRPEYVCIWLGLGKLGVITSLINFNLRLDSLLHCITVSNSKAVVFSSDFADAILDIVGKLPDTLQLVNLGGNNSKVSSISLDEDLKYASSKPPTINYKIGIGDVLLYIFTSGTTGLPKPALVRTRKYVLVSGFGTIFNIGPKDVVYCPLPLYHSAAGILGITFCFILGATVVIRRKFSASRFFDECIENKVTVVQYIGELCRYLLLQPPSPSDTQHTVRLAIGNGLRPKIWREFQSRFKIKQIGEFYAATEGNVGVVNTDGTVGACGFTTRIFPSLYPAKLIRIDPKTKEILRDASGMAINCEPGQPGHFVGKIVQNGSSAFRFDGYLNKQDTAKKIGRNIFSKDDYAFLSGDVVVQDEYGYVYFQDRTGDTFRWRGENVSTAEVESIISKVLGLCDVVVYGVEVPGTEGKAGMVTIADPEELVDVGTLAHKLESVLPPYARPVFVRIVQAVQITGTFKFQKNELKEEGFDMNVVKDRLYYFDLLSKSYLPLDNNAYCKIMDGKMRL